MSAENEIRRKRVSSVRPGDVCNYLYVLLRLILSSLVMAAWGGCGVFPPSPLKEGVKQSLYIRVGTYLV